MTITAGIDVGSGAIKSVIVRCENGDESILAKHVSRIRRREISSVVDEVYETALRVAGSPLIDYIATTGDGEDIEFATGHFYGMTTHARGGLFLESGATAVLDVGALHSRAVLMDDRGKVITYKMTSQCASGSGQFLENIARYLGVSQAEIGNLSLSADEPEGVSSICAVLAETDVINMVSRGISTPNILRGIHDSMAGRFARLLRSIGAQGITLMTGGLASDQGLLTATQDAIDKFSLGQRPIKIVSHPDSIYAGAIGAAIWGAFRHIKLGGDHGQ